MSDGVWQETPPEAVEHEPWHVAYGAPEEWAGRVERIADLNERPGYRIHEQAFVAEGAHVVAQRLELGECSMIASGCLVRGEVSFGDNCTFNAGAVSMGKVTVGNDVRIASYAVLVGFNHVFASTEMPIWWQGTEEVGVVIEDDVWIGTHVTILDGVTVGAHSVVAAGSVVSKDVPPYSVVGGVPARVIRSRLDPVGGPAPDRLSVFSRRVAEQWPAVLARCEVDAAEGASYVDVPGAEWGYRPQNDAIEIAAAFGEVADQADRQEWIERLQAQQHPETGLFLPDDEQLDDPLGFELGNERRMYGLLSTGYALEVLGSGPARPVHAIERCTPDELERHLDGLDMGFLAWPSGAWIDGFGTGVHLNRRHHGSSDAAELLWGWLLTHQRESGMWGDHLENFGWLMAVNGFYRLTRGTYAQFGLPVPNPERAIDTVLAHGRDYEWFAPRERTACNMLDVVHPLWLLGRQTDYRAQEIRSAVGALLAGMLDGWNDGEGFAFEAGGPPGLQGTEMWLSIVYLAADLLGESDGLSWEPRGVHRLAPASSLVL